jgi:hypothetical protein
VLGHGGDAGRRGERQGGSRCGDFFLENGDSRLRLGTRGRGATTIGLSG